MSKVESAKGEMWTAQPHLEAGFIAVSPHAKFRTHKDALNCFGYDKIRRCVVARVFSE